MTNEEIQSELSKLSGWELIEVNQVAQLKKVYRFKNFAEALAFSNRVGALAEAHDHHPAILTEWGEVTLNWWTHTTRGLTKNDFAMARAVDHL